MLINIQLLLLALLCQITVDGSTHPCDITTARVVHELFKQSPQSTSLPTFHRPSLRLFNATCLETTEFHSNVYGNDTPLVLMNTQKCTISGRNWLYVEKDGTLQPCPPPVHASTTPTNILYELSTPVKRPSTTIADYRRNQIVETMLKFNHQLISEVMHYMDAPSTANYASTTPTKLDNVTLLGTPFRPPHSIADSAFVLLSTRVPQRTAFLMRAPPLSRIANVFALPLSLSVWYACYALLAVLLFAFFVIAFTEQRHLPTPSTTSEGDPVLTPRLLDLIHLQISAVAQQGAESEPMSAGGRIATFLVFLAFLFVYTAYAGNVVALLSSRAGSVGGVDGLRTSAVQLGVVDDENAPHTFAPTNEPIGSPIAALYTTKVTPECFVPLTVGVEHLRTSFYALHGHVDRMYKRIEHTFTDVEKCQFIEVAVRADPPMMVGVRRAWPLFEQFKMSLLLFYELGMHHRLQRIIFTSRPVCFSGTAAQFVSVSLMDSYFAFVIYIVGVIGSVLMLALEIVIHRLQLNPSRFIKNCKKQEQEDNVFMS